MRRIPRLRRPSGLSSNSSTITAAAINMSRHSQRSAAPFSSSSSSSQSTLTALPSRQRPTATRLLVPQPSVTRFYSSEKQQETAAPTQTPEQAQTQTPSQAQAQAQAPIQEQEQGKELQFASRVADEIIDSETGTPLDWAEEEIVTSEGPYTAPPMRMEAAREEEIADPTYMPASSAEGLKRVGGLSDWWNRRDNWDVGGDFAGFRPRQKVADAALLEAAVRRAVIEAFALREAGREDDLVGVWPMAVSKADLQGLLAWDVKSAENGSPALGGDAAVVAEGLRWKDENVLDVVEDEHPASPSEVLSSEEAAALSQTWDPSWKSISLADPRIRFAVTKRVFQLTGQLIPDHQLPSISTVHSLLGALKKPPKPATLTEEIQTRHADLLAQPNVSFAPKRITRGDKEKALGRFKIMQAEFKKRDLPLDGHGYARKGKEISRLRGGT
ncbi:ribosomal subunit 39S-domain-containing protein [Nemania abortiva]|nr:ribosomal subunit 39S-domain-containing protein [Nemania abortiva]